jgi:hypothetical protein
MAKNYKIIGEKNGQYKDVWITGEDEVEYWRNNTETFDKVHIVVEIGESKLITPKKSQFENFEAFPGVIVKNGRW